MLKLYMCLTRCSIAFTSLTFGVFLLFLSVVSNADCDFLNYNIDSSFVRDLINEKLKNENEKRSYIIKIFKSLNEMQLRQLRRIIEEELEHYGKLLSGKAADQGRFIYWMRNVIDDQLGTLHYDQTFDGHIGLILSGSTVTNYTFSSTNGQQLAITIGDSSIEVNKDTIIYGYDWECYPGLVRVFLDDSTQSYSKNHFVVKLSAIHENVLHSNPLPECVTVENSLPSSNKNLRIAPPQ